VSKQSKKIIDLVSFLKLRWTHVDGGGDQLLVDVHTEI